MDRISNGMIWGETPEGLIEEMAFLRVRLMDSILKDTDLGNGFLWV